MSRILRKILAKWILAFLCSFNISSWQNFNQPISLTNASKHTTLRLLGWMQRRRYWVEHVFEDAKIECGMADYQGRKWSAWHHHMALVMMAMLFMLTERIHHKDIYPMLSCSDIEQLLARFLPRRDVTKEEHFFIGNIDTFNDRRLWTLIPADKNNFSN